MAVLRMWHVEDSHGQIMAVAFRLKLLKYFNVCPLRSEAVTRIPLTRRRPAQQLMVAPPSACVLTLHPTPYTLHRKPDTFIPKPYTLHRTPSTLHPTPYTIHPTPHTLHPTPNTLHPTPYASDNSCFRQGSDQPHNMPASMEAYRPGKGPLGRHATKVNFAGACKASNGVHAHL